MNKLLYILGVALLLIPIGLRVIDGKRQEEKIATYEESVKGTDEDEIVKQLEQADRYNQQLYEEGKIDLYAYERELNLLGNGIMGSIEIPEIDLKLPVYHGTDQEVLAVGVGHLKESSLPVGGENTHSVLTGHRGSPNAQLFTRLDELEKQDVFFIHVGQETLCYRIYEIQTVRPEETEVIGIQKGKDLVSLVTCTPYGLNTHRLVITGEREMEEIKVSKHVKRNQLSKWDKAFLVVPCVSGVVMFIKMKKRKGVSR